MSKGTAPPKIPVIVEHVITGDGLTLCSGHEWKRIEEFNVAKWSCPLCAYLLHASVEGTP